MSCELFWWWTANLPNESFCCYKWALGIVVSEWGKRCNKQTQDLRWLNWFITPVKLNGRLMQNFLQITNWAHLTAYCFQHIWCLTCTRIWHVFLFEWRIFQWQVCWNLVCRLFFFFPQIAWPVRSVSLETWCFSETFYAFKGGKASLWLGCCHWRCYKDTQQLHRLGKHALQVVPDHELKQCPCTTACPEIGILIDAHSVHKRFSSNTG